MAKTMTTLGTKLPAEDKERFVSVADSLGLTPSAALKMFVAAFNARGALPFDVSTPRIPNAETIAAMQEAEVLLANPDTKYYDDVDELFRDIRSE